MSFVSATTGWLGVDDGILFTSDAGHSWRRQLASGRVIEIRAIDATHAWGVSGDGRVLRTTDGTTWQLMSSTLSPIRDIGMADDDFGWALSRPDPPSPFTGSLAPASLLLTHDGARTWTNATIDPVDSACFVDRSVGWAATSTDVLHTVDGGTTWTPAYRLPLSAPGERWRGSVTCKQAGAVVQFTNGTAALSHSPYVIVTTEDAGAAWRIRWREPYTLGQRVDAADGPGSYPALIAMLDTADLYLVGCTPVVETQDLWLASAGAVVADLHYASVSCASDAQFLGRDVGFLVTRAGLLATRDRAKSWSVLYP